MPDELGAAEQRRGPSHEFVDSRFRGSDRRGDDLTPRRYNPSAPCARCSIASRRCLTRSPIDTMPMTLPVAQDRQDDGSVRSSSAPSCFRSCRLPGRRLHVRCHVLVTPAIVERIAALARQRRNDVALRQDAQKRRIVRAQHHDGADLVSVKDISRLAHGVLRAEIEMMVQCPCGRESGRYAHAKSSVYPS